MTELWRAVGGPQAGPEGNAAAVKRRVNAALDADPTERSIHMKQKLRYALAVAAVSVALVGSALAVGKNWDVLTVFFQGDISPAQNYVDDTPRSVSDENYTLTVGSSLSDQTSAYLLVTIQAKNEAAKAFLFSEDFDSIDLFHCRPMGGAAPGEDENRAWHCGMSYGVHARTEDSITYAARPSFPAGTTSLKLWVGPMEEDAVVDIPLNPTPVVKVDIGASGAGTPYYNDGTAGELTVREVRLSPLTCQVDTVWGEQDEPHPNLRFRMADGSIRTQSQMMDFKGADCIDQKEWVYTYDYTFREVLDLSQVRSVMVFDTEYPLDGSQSRAVAQDPALEPFLLPLTDQLRARITEGGGIPVPVRALTETLGGTCEWDAATNDVTCTYRDVSIVLRPGSATVTVDGAAQEVKEVPEARYISDNGDPQWITVAPWYIFQKAWGIDGFVTATRGQTVENADGSWDTPLTWQDWYVIP